MKYYLAIDIGASSGRHIVGWKENGTIQTKEVYRFPNGVTEFLGHLTWDVEALLAYVKAGIAEARQQFPQIESLSIDTWGCDYVLMKGDEAVLPCYAYRDHRTEAIVERVHEIIPFSELYRRTGCQFQSFNTLYQLCDDVKNGRLEGVTDFLMVPEYLMYKLTGVKSKEYTNATTTTGIPIPPHENSPVPKDRAICQKTAFHIDKDGGCRLYRLMDITPLHHQG